MELPSVEILGSSPEQNKNINAASNIFKFDKYFLKFGRESPIKFNISHTITPVSIGVLINGFIAINKTIFLLLRQFLVDPSRKEEKCLETYISFVLNENGETVNAYLTGAPVDKSQFSRAVELAREVSRQ